MASRSSNVLNMQGDDHFYENVGERSSCRRLRLFSQDPRGSMGAKFFDFNLDGLPDLFVTDMHSDMTDAQSKAGRATMMRGFEKIKSRAGARPLPKRCSKDRRTMFSATPSTSAGALGSLRRVRIVWARRPNWPWGPERG